MGDKRPYSRRWLFVLLFIYADARRLHQRADVTVNCAGDGDQVVQAVQQFLGTGNQDVYIALDSNITLGGQGSYGGSSLSAASLQVSSSLTIAGETPGWCTFIDTRMRSGLLPVFQGGLAMLELRNLMLVNLCSLAIHLASGVVYTSAVTLALFNRTGAYQSNIYTNVRMYTQPSDLNTYLYNIVLQQTSNPALVATAFYYLQSSPRIQSVISSITSTSVTYDYLSMPPFRATHLTFTATNDPSDPLLSELRANNTLLPPAYCNGSRLPDSLVKRDVLSSPLWIVTSSDSMTAALSEAVVALFDCIQRAASGPPGAGYVKYPLPSAIMVAGDAAIQDPASNLTALSQLFNDTFWGSGTFNSSGGTMGGNGSTPWGPDHDGMGPGSNYTSPPWNGTGGWPIFNGSMNGRPWAVPGGMPPFNNSMYGPGSNFTGGDGGPFNSSWPFPPFNMSSNEATSWGIANHLIFSGYADTAWGSRPQAALNLSTCSGCLQILTPGVQVSFRSLVLEGLQARPLSSWSAWQCGNDSDVNDLGGIITGIQTTSHNTTSGGVSSAASLFAVCAPSPPGNTSSSIGNTTQQKPAGGGLVGRRRLQQGAPLQTGRPSSSGSAPSDVALGMSALPLWAVSIDKAAGTNTSATRVWLEGCLVRLPLADYVPLLRQALRAMACTAKLTAPPSTVQPPPGWGTSPKRWLSSGVTATDGGMGKGGNAVHNAGSQLTPTPASSTMANRATTAATTATAGSNSSTSAAGTQPAAPATSSLLGPSSFSSSANPGRDALPRFTLETGIPALAGISVFEVASVDNDLQRFLLSHYEGWGVAGRELCFAAAQPFDPTAWAAFLRIQGDPCVGRYFNLTSVAEVQGGVPTGTTLHPPPSSVSSSGNGSNTKKQRLALGLGLGLGLGLLLLATAGIAAFILTRRHPRHDIPSGGLPGSMKRFPSISELPPCGTPRNAHSFPYLNRFSLHRTWSSLYGPWANLSKAGSVKSAGGSSRTSQGLVSLYSLSSMFSSRGGSSRAGNPLNSRYGASNSKYGNTASMTHELYSMTSVPAASRAGRNSVPDPVTGAGTALPSKAGRSSVPEPPATSPPPQTPSPAAAGVAEVPAGQEQAKHHSSRPSGIAALFHYEGSSRGGWRWAREGYTTHDEGYTTHDDGRRSLQLHQPPAALRSDLGDAAVQHEGQIRHTHTLGFLPPAAGGHASVHGQRVLSMVKSEGQAEINTTEVFTGAGAVAFYPAVDHSTMHPSSTSPIPLQGASQLQGHQHQPESLHMCRDADALNLVLGMAQADAAGSGSTGPLAQQCAGSAGPLTHDMMQQPHNISPSPWLASSGVVMADADAPLLLPLPPGSAAPAGPTDPIEGAELQLHPQHIRNLNFQRHSALILQQQQQPPRLSASQQQHQQIPPASPQQLVGDAGYESGLQGAGSQQPAMNVSNQEEFRAGMRARVAEVAGGIDEDPNKLVLVRAIGRGSWGKVYLARWRGLNVAVKTVLFADVKSTRPGVLSIDRAVREAAVCTSIVHANVVATFSYDIHVLSETPGDSASNGLQVDMRISPQELRKPRAKQEGGHTSGDHGSGRGSHSSSHSSGVKADVFKLYLMQELCDTTLSDAMQAGVLHDMSDGGKPHMGTVLPILLDIVTGVSHLHTLGIVHSDLKPANVMLSADSGHGPGVIAKVTDFGLSAVLDPGASHLSNFCGGTMGYMAPEVLGRGQVSSMSDVYSIGVIMWCLYHNSHPYTEDKSGQPTKAEGFPVFLHPWFPWFQQLSTQCMHQDPAQRPPLSTLQQELGWMISAYQAGLLLTLEDRLSALAVHKSSVIEQAEPLPPPDAAGDFAGTVSCATGTMHQQHQQCFSKVPLPAALVGGNNNRTSCSGHMQKRSWPDRGSSALSPGQQWARGNTDIEAWADLSGKHQPPLDVPGELLDVTTTAATGVLTKLEAQDIPEEDSYNKELQVAAEAPPTQLVLPPHARPPAEGEGVYLLPSPSQQGPARQRSVFGRQQTGQVSGGGACSAPIGLGSTAHGWRPGGPGTYWAPDSNKHGLITSHGYRPPHRSPASSGGQQPDLLGGRTAAAQSPVPHQYTAVDAARQDDISCQSAALVSMVLDARTALQQQRSNTSGPPGAGATNVTWGLDEQHQYELGDTLGNGEEGLHPCFTRFSQPLGSDDEVLLPSDDSNG